jgi:tRNA-dihydrouridine synthase B
MLLSRCGRAIDPPLVLAPMVGITDAIFRQHVRGLGGVGLVTAEFVSSRGLATERRSAARLLRFDSAERPLAVQIYGSDPQQMAAAAARVEALGVDVCDLNMGCPARDIRRHGSGAALLGDLARAQAIIVACRRELRRTALTVKMRAGVDQQTLTFAELGRICEGEGVDAVTLHPRTATQMYRGRADWDLIARLREVVRIPVIGNGDVATPEDVLAMRAHTGCDAVMIGRAVLADPWIFRHAAALLEGRTYRAPPSAERSAFIIEHFALVERSRADGDAAVVGKLRTLTAGYAQGLPADAGRALRRRLSGLATPAAFREAIVQAFGERDAAASGPGPS